jgi:hypothetical protein
MSWSSRLLVLGCLIGGLQVIASLALLARAPIEGTAHDDAALARSSHANSAR